MLILIVHNSGLASSGGDCGKADEPVVFVDVSQYSDWIKKVMEDANCPA